MRPWQHTEFFREFRETTTIANNLLAKLSMIIIHTPACLKSHHKYLAFLQGQISQVTELRAEDRQRDTSNKFAKNEKRFSSIWIQSQDSLNVHIRSLHEGIKYLCSLWDYQANANESIKNTKLQIHRKSSILGLSVKNTIHAGSILQLISRQFMRKSIIEHISKSCLHKYDCDIFEHKQIHISGALSEQSMKK